MGEIRDPVHGFVDIDSNSIIWKLIATPAFQRLRRVRQLAMAYLVYPSANHSRFEHSLGTMSVAEKMYDRLADATEKSDPVSKDRVRIAALLHDIGHGPFSHISEYVWTYFNTINGEAPAEEFHEAITKQIIRRDKQIQECFSSGEDTDYVISILSKESAKNYEHSIVSSSLDADKMDYLLRDSYFCGVEYGKYDLQRLLRVIERESREDRLVVKEEGMTTLAQFNLAKYYLTDQVYYHKVRRITDEMIIRALTLGVQVDEIPVLKKLYMVGKLGDLSDEFLSRFQESWDDKLMLQLTDLGEASYARTIFQKLARRDLFCRIESLSIVV